mmetsp:Transcript_12407/g.28301  ORF Transcript_12407/g.28301 Transcript_12407/m.28301 type:complete len:214 (-) Transcript_12407:447-1088(-)
MRTSARRSSQTLVVGVALAASNRQWSSVLRDPNHAALPSHAAASCCTLRTRRRPDRAANKTRREVETRLEPESSPPLLPPPLLPPSLLAELLETSVKLGTRPAEASSVRCAAHASRVSVYTGAQMCTAPQHRDVQRGSKALARSEAQMALAVGRSCWTSGAWRMPDTARWVGMRPRRSSSPSGSTVFARTSPKPISHSGQIIVKLAAASPTPR